jgi:hypothetical protein
MFDADELCDGEIRMHRVPNSRVLRVFARARDVVPDIRPDVSPAVGVGVVRR